MLHCELEGMSMVASFVDEDVNDAIIARVNSCVHRNVWVCTIPEEHLVPPTHKDLNSIMHFLATNTSYAFKSKVCRRAFAMYWKLEWAAVEPPEIDLKKGRLQKYRALTLRGS